jgi:hypothetical protein
MQEEDSQQNKFDVNLSKETQANLKKLFAINKPFAEFRSDDAENISKQTKARLNKIISNNKRELNKVTLWTKYKIFIDKIVAFFVK